MITEPRNEIELIILFAQHCAINPKIKILSFDGSFPDSKVLWKGKEYRTEFELKASNFESHCHDPLGCDIIVCWNNDYPNSVLPVIALNEPDWFDKDIIIVNDSEKLASYWKRRALSAEKALSSFSPQKQGKSLFPIYIPTKDSEEVIKTRIINEYNQMIRNNEEISYSKICKRVLGGIGGNQYIKVKKIIEKID